MGEGRFKDLGMAHCEWLWSPNPVALRKPFLSLDPTFSGLRGW